MNVLGDRVLELGPKPDADSPYRNFKLTRDEDGVAWLLFDRDGTSANTLSAGPDRGARQACWRRWRASGPPAS